MSDKIDAVPAGVTLRQLADTPTDAEYDGIVALMNACEPDHPRTADELRSHDARREAQYFLARFVAEQEGQIVGAGSTGHSPWRYDPRKFWIGVNVLPTMRRQGIGAALYDSLYQTIAPFDPIKLDTGVREDRTDAVNFALRRGFTEQMREWESRLDVTSFDPAPFAARRDVPGQHGVAVASLKALQDTTPDWASRLYELEKETSEDVPRTDPFTFPDFAGFERMILSGPGFYPEGSAIAYDRKTGEWVGSSGLWKRQADKWLGTGLTAVKRSRRRQGIAFAMKLHVIDHAQSVGCPVITTENATTNRAMLSINEALGYQKQPAWLVMEWFAEGQPAK